MLILTERTPNPQAMKFIPERPLTDGGAFAFLRATFDPERSALAAAVFALAGVEAVYIAPAFMTVTRSPQGPPWSVVRLEIIAAFADHLASGAPAVQVVGQAATAGSYVAGADSIVDEIREVLGRWVRPGVAQDGGDVVFERFDVEDGVLWIRMEGACGGCPSSRLTLKAGVEQIVRRYVPEVQRVEDVQAPATISQAARLQAWVARFGGGARRAGPPQRPLFTHAGRPIRDDAETSASADADN